MEAKKEITYAQKYGPLEGVRTQEEADRYFEMCVQHSMSFGKSRDEAEALERSNIGYWSGYLSDEARARVLRLLKTEHPVFGTYRPTSEEALGAGMAMARGTPAAELRERFRRKEMRN